MKRGALPLEGLEPLRLIDTEGMSRKEAARMMNVSTPTPCRILAEARSIVARAPANGWALRIEGGDYMIAETENRKNCTPAHHCRRRNRKQKKS